MNVTTLTDATRQPAPSALPRGVRVAIVVNEDWFFLSHRLPLAQALRQAGADVTVIAGDTGQGAAIEAAGFTFVALPIERKSVNPFRDLRTIRFLRQAYRRLQPDLVHHVTIKPVLYGSLAARSGRMAVVNAITGLGYAFSSGALRARLIRPVVRLLYRVALHRPRTMTVFQNPEDRQEFVAAGWLAPEQSVLIRGSGVDCARFRPSDEPAGAATVLFASRLLWDKGVREFVAAARLLRDRHRTARFVIVGAPDQGNPSAVPRHQLEAWRAEGAVEWWGHRDDMADVLAQSSVVVLPTVYGEGIPKILLEAAASARPIVATDVRGCREIVRPGVNGILVPPRRVDSLATAIDALLDSPALRRRLGAAGRVIAEQEFATDIVIEQTLGVYARLLASSSGRPA